MSAVPRGIPLSIVTLPFDAGRDGKVANQSLLSGRGAWEAKTAVAWTKPEGNQNANFRANCISLGAAALTTCPNVDPLMLPLTDAGP
jgi:hypothetical protein